MKTIFFFTFINTYIPIAIFKISSNFLQSQINNKRLDKTIKILKLRIYKHLLLSYT